MYETMNDASRSSSGSSAFFFILFVISSSSENWVVFYSQMEECLFCRELAEDHELSLLINYIKFNAHSFHFHLCSIDPAFERKRYPPFSFLS